MRDHGTLTKWDDDRGFGFISPLPGKKEIFVHISAFPRDGRRPELHELVSFETETEPNGKLRAVRVMRPGQRSASQRHQVSRRGRLAPRPIKVFFCVLAIIVIGAYSYSRLGSSVPETEPAPTAMASPTPTIDRYSRSPSSVPRTKRAPTAEASRTPAIYSKCDGRTRCSQMTSCEEARYFLQHCPDTQMDGDNDGEPCERQWCN